jgi:hypothetical protein
VDEEIAAGWLRHASPRTVDLWIVPGAGHTRGLATRGIEWEKRVTGFLDAALGPGSGTFGLPELGRLAGVGVVPVAEHEVERW